MEFPTLSRIKQLGIRPVKARGQNFLIDRTVAARAVAAAGVQPGDAVIEIGPGPGALTCFLAETGARADLFEIDRNLAALLAAQITPHPELRLVQQDILRADFSHYAPGPAALTVIGSIPYGITSPILTQCLRAGAHLRRCVFILQEDVARRVCAPSGTRQYGVLSVLCQAYARVEVCGTIPRDCFYPRPGVSSALLTLEPARSRHWNDPAQDYFREVVGAAFSQRRKTLANSLRPFLTRQGIALEDMRARAAQAGLDLQRRAETLSIPEFDTMTRLIATRAK